MSRYAWSAEQWHFLMSKDGDTGERALPRLRGDLNFQTHQSNISTSAWIFMNKKRQVENRAKIILAHAEEEHGVKASLFTTLLLCLLPFARKLRGYEVI